MVELRPFNWANIGIHYKWNNDEELNYYDSDFPHHQESFDSFVHRVKEIESPANITTRIMEIFHVDDDELIGVIDIHGIDHVNHRCVIEATIGNKNYRNKGLGKVAVKSAVTYCFEELNMNKISTSAFDFNQKWIKLVEDLGFEEEGRLRSHSLKKGEYCDKLIFGLLKSDFNVEDYGEMSEVLLKQA